MSYYLCEDVPKVRKGAKRSAMKVAEETLKYQESAGVPEKHRIIKEYGRAKNAEKLRKLWAKIRRIYNGTDN